MRVSDTIVRGGGGGGGWVCVSKDDSHMPRNQGCGGKGTLEQGTHGCITTEHSTPKHGTGGPRTATHTRTGQPAPPPCGPHSALAAQAPCHTAGCRLSGRTRGRPPSAPRMPPCQLAPAAPHNVTHQHVQQGAKALDARRRHSHSSYTVCKSVTVLVDGIAIAAQAAVSGCSCCKASKLSPLDDQDNLQWRAVPFTCTSPVIPASILAISPKQKAHLVCTLLVGIVQGLGVERVPAKGCLLLLLLLVLRLCLLGCVQPDGKGKGRVTGLNKMER